MPRRLVSTVFFGGTKVLQRMRSNMFRIFLRTHAAIQTRIVPKGYSVSAGIATKQYRAVTDLDQSTQITVTTRARTQTSIAKREGQMVRHSRIRQQIARRHNRPRLSPCLQPHRSPCLPPRQCHHLTPRPCPRLPPRLSCRRPLSLSCR